MEKIKNIISNDKLSESIDNLNKLYSKMPKTKGCMENIEKKEGGCGAWCCRLQNPQVLYVEFLNSWRHVLKTWQLDDIVSLVERALRNYLSDSVNKGCIFWKSETKLCTQHSTRPYNCRTYGVVPDKEFKPRYERLKVINEARPDAIIKDQCNLVSTVDDKPVTVNDTKNWWEELVKVERSIGVDKKEIHDNFGGTYRTYHDHLLIQLFSDNMLSQLSAIRQHGSDLDKDHAVKVLLDQIRANFEKVLKVMESQNATSTTATN